MASFESKTSLNRFGDDLIEQVFSYLPFEDKFRFECLSKQFQRCVFISQLDLIIDRQLTDRLKSSDRLELKSNFETILKKCGFIKCIRIKGCSQTLITLKLLNLVFIFLEYIPNLCELDISSKGYQICPYEPNITFESISTPINNIYKKLISIIGSKIKNSEQQSVNRYLELRPIITNISVECISNLFIRGKLLATNLNAVSFDCFSDSDLELLKTFIDNNQNLKRLRICGPVCSVNIFEPLLKLSQIEDLDIDLCHISDNTMESIKQFVFKSINLKGFSLSSIELSPKNQIQLLNMISNLSKIKRIRLDLCDFRMSQTERQSLIISHSNYSFENWINVTHLTLYLEHIDDSLFQDIDKYLPKLQYLCILDIKANLTQKTIDCLAKLPKLQSFESQTTATSALFSANFIDMIEKCPKIKRISIWAPFFSAGHIKYQDKDIYTIKKQLLEKNN